MKLSINILLKMYAHYFKVLCRIYLYFDEWFPWGDPVDLGQHC
jgi:hypothetical protein